MTPELLQVIKVKNKAKWFAFKTKDPHDIATYKLLKNKLKTSIHEAKLSYVKLLVQELSAIPICPVNCGMVLMISLEGLSLVIL